MKAKIIGKPHKFGCAYEAFPRRAVVQHANRGVWLVYMRSVMYVQWRSVTVVEETNERAARSAARLFCEKGVMGHGS